MLHERSNACADVAQLVEQLICNQPVGGSSPLIGSVLPEIGEVAKRSNAPDCKSGGRSLRRFESSPPHYMSSSD